ncbi:MAG TPA: hypothetical protein PK668_24340 [Myxococcota bacterium]|nr:hypothetical protein [Myxococcota bacterium]HRY95390.1 hypothetical protein [Myxococcota bacterium]HSA24563.1 hypothetical protein [Myxococcota bacterium]
MKKLMWITLAGLFVLAASCAKPEGVAPAGEPGQAAPAEPAQPQPPAPAKVESAPAPAAETATFAVPGLNAELVTKLTQALADKPGVVSAKADEAGGTYAVSFTPGQTSPDALLKALQAVKADCSLKGVAPAAGDDGAAPKHDCGGCPYHDTCGK